MADVAAQTGIVSGFGFGKETTPTVTSAPVAPTDIIDVDSFDATDDPSVVVFSVMRRSRNSEMQTRSGVHKLTAKLACPAYSVQAQPLVIGAIGFDTMSGATAVTGTTAAGSTVVGGTTITWSAAIPTPPAGISNWVGAPITIDTAGLQETKLVLAQSGLTMTVTPMANAHAGGVALSIPVTHCGQENVGANLLNLNSYSIYAQFGRMFERQFPYGQVARWGIKGDNEKLSFDFDFVFSGALPTHTSTLTTLTPAAGEANDSPFIQRDGGLLTYFKVGDTAPTMHNRLTSLQYDLTNEFKSMKWGGGNQLSEFNVLAKRTHKLTWKEDAGQTDPVPDIYLNYVYNQVEMPAFLAYRNLKSGNFMSLYFPRCIVNRFDPAGPTDNPIGYDGELTPMEDPVQGFSLRYWVYNGSTVVY